MLSLTSHLARFASELKVEDVPEDVLERAVLALRDLAGIALAEAHSPLTDQLLRVARHAGGAGDCVLPGRHERLSPFWGAAVMGASAHHAELDDGHLGGHVHPGVTTIPALLMDAQRCPTRGEDLLAALVASYEISIRVGEAISPAAQYERGFHIPGLVGTLGALIGVGRLRGLSPAELERVLGTAVLGPLTPFAAFSSGAPVKDLYGGWPAALGILGNDLAVEGITGPAGVLEDTMGWFATVGATEEAAIPSEELALGRAWRIRETYVKVHAACSFSHSPIDAALDLFNPDTRGDDIAEVVVATHVFADRLAEPRPTSSQGARFSIPWVVAAALRDGEVGPAATDPLALGDPQLQALAARVRVVSGEEATRRHLLDDRVRPARVQVKYSDGSTRASEKSVGRGGPESPLNEQELLERFTKLLQGYDDAHAVRIWDACGQVRQENGVAELVEALSVTPSSTSKKGR